MFQHQIDRGGESQQWVIVSEVGGLTFLHEVKKGDRVDVPVFCGSLDKARRFRSLGEMMEVLAMIPSGFEAYEEDPRFLYWMGSHEYPATPEDCE